MAEPRLDTLQRWMSLVVQHPRDAEAAVREEDARALIQVGAVLAGDVVKSSAAMPPLQRLDVYNNAYLSRLIEVLETDYGALKYALGDEAWHALARDYVYAFPSRHPNLNGFGRRLPGYVAERGGLAHQPFLTELARWLWAMVEAFDAPEFTPLDMSRLQSLGQDEWARAVLQPNPSLRLLATDYPVDAFVQDFFDDKQPALPAPQPSFGSIYRKHGRVWRTRLPGPIFAILGALAGGQPFARALEAGGEHGEDLGRWFQEWSADGVFVAVQLQ